MKMKKLILSFLTVFSLLACSTDDENTGGDNGSGISNSPLSGKLYGVNFTADGGRADLNVVFGDAVVEIRIGSEGLACETSQFSGEFPIRITAPRTEGTHNSNVYVTFNDPNSDSFISVSGGIEIEIITLTETSVDFKIKATSTSTDNNINGRHQVVICE